MKKLTRRLNEVSLLIFGSSMSGAAGLCGSRNGEKHAKATKGLRVQIKMKY